MRQFEDFSLLAFLLFCNTNDRGGAFPGQAARMQQEGFPVFSTLYSARTLLKTLIEHPAAVRVITQHDDSLQEVSMNNPEYGDLVLRQLPFLGEALILRIYRGESFIIPHGNTQMKLGDRLLVSGPGEHVMRLKSDME